MHVEIDPSAGFCFGVEKAIKKAEVELADNETLYCLGEIVHNGEEINRLSKHGLKTINSSTFNTIKNASVMIRAHGEPPETYRLAKENNIQLIEATCPIVLKLQKRVHAAWQEMKSCNGSVVLVGKKGHPEMVGLNGQTNHNAVIIENINELNKINFHKPIRIFAQTTFDNKKYTRIIHQIENQLKRSGNQNENIDFKVFHSICGQVSNRIPKLTSFCKKHDVIIFVSGKNSSNGKSLFGTCKATNPASYHISSTKELNPDWTSKAGSVGISGATSTPFWLMKEIANKLS